MLLLTTFDYNGRSLFHGCAGSTYMLGSYWSQQWARNISPIAATTHFKKCVS
jgi:hypothetical protein